MGLIMSKLNMNWIVNKTSTLHRVAEICAVVISDCTGTTLFAHPAVQTRH